MYWWSKRVIKTDTKKPEYKGIQDGTRDQKLEGIAFELYKQKQYNLAIQYVEQITLPSDPITQKLQLAMI